MFHAPKQICPKPLMYATNARKSSGLSKSGKKKKSGVVICDVLLLVFHWSAILASPIWYALFETNTSHMELVMWAMLDRRSADNIFMIKAQ